MPNTLISDIITPDVWNSYGVNRSVELSRLRQSGIVATALGVSLPNGGATINMPFFSDLSGDAETLSDTTPLTPGNIGTGKDVAVVIGRGRAWSVNDLAGVLSGADPARAIMDLVAAWWVRQEQKELIAALTGAFGAASMSGNVSDISGETGAAAVIGASTFIDATQKLGDQKDLVTGVAMHSATEAKLAKEQLIDYVQPAGQSVRMPNFMGKPVIVDDGMPVSSGVYTTYLFGPGAIGFAENRIGPSDLETDRDILAGDTVMTMRRRFLMHPRGIKWKGVPAGDFPTRAELAAGTNWERVYDSKQIRIVQFKHKLA
jgi:hypothetical protein